MPFPMSELLGGGAIVAVLLAIGWLIICMIVTAAKFPRSRDLADSFAAAVGSSLLILSLSLLACIALMAMGFVYPAILEAW